MFTCTFENYRDISSYQPLINEEVGPLKEHSKKIWEGFFDVDSCWAEYAEKEIAIIRKHLPENLILRLEEIGSSSIGTIKSHRNIEFVLLVKDQYEARFYISRLFTCGYHVGHFSDKMILFTKDCLSQKSSGNFVYQIFLVDLKSFQIYKNLVNFRDYLKQHPKLAKEYEQLKISTAKQAKTQDEYMCGRSSFIKNVVIMAMGIMEEDHA